MVAKAKPSDVQQATFVMKPTEVAEAIIGMKKTNRALFIWGPPGISKSAVSQQVATLLGVAFIDVRLSQMDPTDLRGIPFPTDEGGVQGISWSAPLVLPRDLDIQGTREIEAIPTIVRFYNPKGVNGIHYCKAPNFEVTSLTKGAKAVLLKVDGDRAVVALTDGTKNEAGEPNLVAGKVAFSVTGTVEGIIGLEEFNSAPPSVQAAAYQLILDRRLGEYEVPASVYMIAMGNRDTDKGVTFKMPTPISNRFVHIEMKHNFDDWQMWAFGELIHPQVMGFLTAFQNQLFQFNAGTAARGFPTPRSWHFVSDILRENANDLPENVLRGLVIGAVGDSAGMEFMEFRKIAEQLPRVDDILSGRLEKLPDKDIEPSLAFALTTTMCYRLKENIDEIVRKFNGAATPSDKKAMKESADHKRWVKEADNFLAFILKNFKPEIGIMGAKASLAKHKLPFDAQQMRYFELFADKYKNFIL